MNSWSRQWNPRHDRGNASPERRECRQRHLPDTSMRSQSIASRPKAGPAVDSVRVQDRNSGRGLQAKTRTVALFGSKSTVPGRHEFAGSGLILNEVSQPGDFAPFHHDVEDGKIAPGSLTPRWKAYATASTVAPRDTLPRRNEPSATEVHRVHQALTRAYLTNEANVSGFPSPRRRPFFQGTKPTPRMNLLS